MDKSQTKRGDPVKKPGTQSKSRDKVGTTTVSRIPDKKKEETVSIFSWHLGKRNILLFLTGLVVIILGYIFLSIGTFDSFSSLTIAPILLVLGYLVIIPLSIILKDPAKKPVEMREKS